MNLFIQIAISAGVLFLMCLGISIFYDFVSYGRVDRDTFINAVLAFFAMIGVLALITPIALLMMWVWK